MALISYSPTRPAVRIRLVGTEVAHPSVKEIGLFLSDFALLHDVYRLSLDPKYRGYTFSRFTLYRNNRTLDEREQLLIEELHLASPLELVAAVVGISAGTAAAVWGFVQSAIAISNHPLNQEKLRLENRKLALEVERAERERVAVQQATDAGRRPIAPGEPLGLFLPPEAGLPDDPQTLIRRLERRLLSSPVQIRQIDFEVVEPPANRETRDHKARELGADGAEE